MIDSNTILNTCYETAKSVRVIANYSHIIPIILSLSLALFIFFKSKFNLFSKIFLSFVISFCIWLVGDLIAWTSNDYHLVYSVWAFLDYIEILFFILGLYFVIAFVNERDTKVYKKIIFIVILIAPLIITITGHSVEGFTQSVCEALNNNFLSNYKLLVESGIGISIIVYLIASIFKKQSREDKKADIIVLSSILLFLSFFGVTEYVASITGIYEYNLYSLFILPLFLIAIIYSVFELDIFHFNILGTHYLVVGLVILSGGQLFFINTAADRLLTVLTVSLTVGLSIILFRNLKKESDQRVHIEKLSVDLADSKLRLEDTNIKLENANDKLKDLDKLKTEFLSLATHQIRAPLTAIKGYGSMLMEGDFGVINAKAKEAVSRIFQSSNNLAIVVEDFLNVSKIESGGMKYEKVDFDFGEVANAVSKDQALIAEKKGLKLHYTQDQEKHTVNGDKEKLRQVVINLIDNSIKYTKKGTVDVSVTTKDDKMVFSVKDTGMGMTPEIKATLFQKFARGEGGRVNTSGSGLGLYLAKEIAVAHGGHVSVESEGPNKGSTFSMELNVVK